MYVAAVYPFWLDRSDKIVYVLLLSCCLWVCQVLRNKRLTLQMLKFIINTVRL